MSKREAKPWPCVCGREFWTWNGLSRHAGLYGHAAKLDRKTEPRPILEPVGQCPPRQWFLTDQGTWVGSGGDGRPWVAYPIDSPRP